MIKDRVFETEWILWHIEKHGLNRKMHRFFLDVGAGDGMHCSNSLPFIEMGWSALLIDGLETNINECKRVHMARPFVKCIQAILSDKIEQVHFEQDSRFWALSAVDYTKPANAVAQPLSGILHANKVKKIGIASIDIEGNEAKVLTDLISNNIFPQIMIVEANELTQAHEHREILRQHYKLQGGVQPNEFFVRKDLAW